MPLNTYFSNGSGEELDLYEDLIIEAMKIYGRDMTYIPRKIIKRDLILNEDLISEFNSAFPIEMYVESIDGFEGDGKILSQFGLEIRDQVTLVVSRLRWNQLVGRWGYDKNTVRPKEGDLIYFPLTEGLFEIKFVEDKKPFHQLGEVPVYKLICEVFEYESQELDTGIDEVDHIQTAHSQGFKFEIDDNYIGSFTVGETLTLTLPSGVTGSAEFFNYEVTSDVPPKTRVRIGPLTFDDGEWHELRVGTAIINGDQSASAIISDVYDLQDSDQLNFATDVNAQNSSFSENAQLFIDWSEHNPFGEPFKYQ